MHKKTLFFIISCTIFSNFQTQAAQERNTALGIGLFAGTIFLTKYQQRQVQPDEAATDVQRIVRGHQARKQAAILKDINLATKQAEAAVKIQNRQPTAAVTTFNLRQPQTAAMIEDENHTENYLAHQLSAGSAGAVLLPPAIRLLATPPAASSSPQCEQLSSTTITYSTIKKNSVSFPDFSDPIFAQLHTNPHLGYNRKRKEPAFLDSAIVEVNKEKNAQFKQSESLNRILKQATFKPNHNHNYWQQKEIQPSEKTITIFYLPGSYNESIHGTHEQATLANEQEMTLFAKKVAIAENATVKVVYFQWDGAISQKNRSEAGVALAQAITENPAYKIFTISHSHGGNVVLHAAQTLKRSKKSIDHAILCGCPAPDENIDIHSNNIKTILNIYSDGDCTAAGGSYLQTANINTLINPNSRTTTTALSKQAHNITNIQLKIHGDDPEHRDTTSNSIDHLPEIIQCLNTQYPGIQNIVANVHNDGLHACLEDTKNHKNATDEMREESEKQAQEFFDKYGISIHEKSSLVEKFDQEIGNHLYPIVENKVEKLCGGKGAVSTAVSKVVNTTIKAAVQVAESLENDPVENFIRDQIKIIEQEPNLSEQTNLLAQIQNKLFEQHSSEYILQKLETHKKYNKLKRNLERQQFFSQCIIGTTRNYETILEEAANKNKKQWFSNLKPQLDAAQKIYQQLNDEVTLGFLSGYDKLEPHTQESFMHDALSGYNELEAQTQQALLSALKPDLERKVKDYLDKQSPKQRGHTQGFMSAAAGYVPSWLKALSTTNSSSSDSISSLSSEKKESTSSSDRTTQEGKDEFETIKEK